MPVDYAGPRRRAPSLTVVCAAVLLVPVTATGSAEALGDIGADLRAGLDATQWVVNAFFLTFAAFMASTGALADRIGRRRMFALGAGVFTAAMLLAAAAPDIGTLIAARALAGAGAAAAMTGGTALLAQAYPSGAGRTRAFAWFGTTIGLGLAFGPVIAGTLVGAVGWRVLFGAAGIALLPVLLLSALLEESRAASDGPMDWGGAVTFTLALTAFTFGVIEGLLSGGRTRRCRPPSPRARSCRRPSPWPSAVIPRRLSTCRCWPGPGSRRSRPYRSCSPSASSR